MVDHLVWFKLKDTATDADRESMVAALRGLADQIPGIVTLGAGRDFSGRSRGFEIGLTIRFGSRDALKQYDSHPDHRGFVERFKPLWDEVMALDFEA